MTAALFGSHWGLRLVRNTPSNWCNQSQKVQKAHGIPITTALRPHLIERGPRTMSSTSAATSSSTVPTADAVANRLNVDVETKTYRNPALTVDALVVRRNTVLNSYELLVIQRGRNPYQGYWALPGGFVEYGEDPEAAARRELKEETLIDTLPGSDNIQLITVRGKGDRDPRQHIVTIAYALRANAATLADCAGSDDAKAARWIPLSEIGGAQNPLAFDHVHIVDSLRAWFAKEGEARGFYVVDQNPLQPGQNASK